MANIFKEYSEVAKKKIKPTLPPLYNEASFKRYFNLYNSKQSKKDDQIPKQNIDMAREELEDGGWARTPLMDIAKQLLDGAAIDGGGYSYRANKTLNVFTASDGSRIRTNLLAFILDYVVGIYSYELNGGEFGDFSWVDIIEKEDAPEDQEGYESGTRRGDFERKEKTNKKEELPYKIFKNADQYDRWRKPADKKQTAEMKGKKIAVGKTTYNNIDEYERQLKKKRSY